MVYMKTAKEILDEINDEEDWIRDKETGRPKRILVSLSRIIDDSSKLRPRVNIRSLNPEKIKQIKEDILKNKNTVTTAWAMKLDGNRFCIIDGNHKQAAVKEHCAEIGKDCKNKKYGFNKIEIQILRGDPTTKKGSWEGHCVSYRINRRDATTVEKILAIGYGWEYYGEHDRYLSNLMRDFGESRDNLRYHKSAYVLLMELNPEDYESFIDTYKYKEKLGIRTAIKKLQEITEASKPKKTENKQESTEPSDPLIGSIVNDAKIGDEVITGVVNSVSLHFAQNVKISKLRKSVVEAIEQIKSEGVSRNINILNNRYYSPMKGSLEELEKLKKSERDLPSKLLENIRGYHKDLHKLMMVAKRN